MAGSTLCRKTGKAAQETERPVDVNTASVSSASSCGVLGAFPRENGVRELAETGVHAAVSVLSKCQKDWRQGERGTRGKESAPRACTLLLPRNVSLTRPKTASSALSATARTAAAHSAGAPFGAEKEPRPLPLSRREDDGAAAVAAEPRGSGARMTSRRYPQPAADCGAAAEAEADAPPQTHMWRSARQSAAAACASWWEHGAPRAEMPVRAFTMLRSTSGVAESGARWPR